MTNEMFSISCVGGVCAELVWEKQPGAMEATQFRVPCVYFPRTCSVSSQVATQQLDHIVQAHKSWALDLLILWELVTKTLLKSQCMPSFRYCTAVYQHDSPWSRTKQFIILRPQSNLCMPYRCFCTWFIFVGPYVFWFQTISASSLVHVILQLSLLVKHNNKFVSLFNFLSSHHQTMLHY